MTTQIGLIGFGSIGQAVFELVQSGRAGEAEIARVLRRSGEGMVGVPVTNVAADFFATRYDTIVEAAGQEAFRQHMRRAVAGCHRLVIASSGALGDPVVLNELTELVRIHGTEVLVSSGAIAAIDWIMCAAELGPPLTVALTMRKPLRAWSGTHAEVSSGDVDEPKMIFRGSAREAARMYPANANSAITLGLAVGNVDGVEVTLIADPAIDMNTVDVEVVGKQGHLQYTLSNEPSAANPKTSAIVALAIVRAVRGQGLTVPR